MGASRALRLSVLAIAALLSGSAFAGAPSLVVDLQSGRVLHADRATDPWFPASITKLMTTYVALDMARRGQVSMETLLTVTDAAAALPPSKMAFKPGTQIRLDNALKIIMVKSANDVAATIAENLGGSIDGFAALMNQKAREIGMHESRFANPHGLPDERNQTSARDMAILARTLLTQFPEYNDLFHIGAIQYGRRVMRNTNGLIGRYPGADGMKTGFICASGFNVVATATRNGRQLITVVLGAPSANERTMKAAELFDRGFGSSPSLAAYSLENLPDSASTAPPDMRSVICDRRGPVGEDSQTTVAEDNATPNLLSPSSNVFAFAGGNAQPLRTTLGPRAAVQPVPVWIGLNPPSEKDLAAQAAEEDAAEKARQAKKASKTAKKPAKATDAKTADKADDADAPEVKKDKSRASVSLKPVSDAAKKVDTKAADTKKTPAKPQAAADTKAEPKADAKADAKPAAKTPPKRPAAQKDKPKAATEG
ncbi:D-alanyl-D-alanine carboxypeptidase family protein [Microvirga pudoricolor]|uniref:D-alanyl-D-alanine carboxypeptidase family protein n=1 Tax=Microvirga pudoricolor TaxID=2778729 RepID=UPI00194DB7BA|nr:D-alanyl-D-alanine carboxypeptidase family protein [Microvirga pudoricolor]MBM6593524.1 D-alanyl-D-alanine carboxypeptidase [Microvirga pudoricolor]